LLSLLQHREHHIDECAECLGKPWGEEFLAVKAEIENDSSNSIF